MELRATLKCAAVRAIGNLCCERESLRLAAGARGAVLAVLRCARLTDNDRPFIVQWSVAALRHLCMGCPENQKFILEMDQKPSGVIDRQRLLKELGINVKVDATTGAVRLITPSKNMAYFESVSNRKRPATNFMEFSEIERAVYGGNVEDDPELLAELLALQQEEEAKQRRSALPPPIARAPPPKSKIDGALGLDPAILAAALADDVEIDDSALENDPDLLAELSGLVGESATEAAPPPAPPSALAQTVASDNAVLVKLRGLLAVYEKMLNASTTEGNTAKQRRHQRCVDKLKELISKAERGLVIDEADIPPAPPSFAPASGNAQPSATVASLQPPPIPKRTSSSPNVPSGSGLEAPPVPERTSSSSVPPEPTNADVKKQKILAVLKRRRNEYVANGKAAVAAMDKPAAKHYVETAKLFDQVE
ncbi:unnamed protein product, partial [Strongylus vulgaris]